MTNEREHDLALQADEDDVQGFNPMIGVALGAAVMGTAVTLGAVGMAATVVAGHALATSSSQTAIAPATCPPPTGK